jgi:hypothetical protein
VYWLRRRESGEWSARLPVARFASAGPIRLFVFLARCGRVERHGVTAGAVAVVHEVSGVPPCGGVAPDGFWTRRGGEMSVTQMSPVEPYEAPVLARVGDLASLTKGTASSKHSDDNDGSSYYDTKYTEVR